MLEPEVTDDGIYYTISINGVTSNYSGNYTISISPVTFRGVFNYRLYDEDGNIVVDLIYTLNEYSSSHNFTTILRRE